MVEQGTGGSSAKEPVDGPGEKAERDPAYVFAQLPVVPTGPEGLPGSLELGVFSISLSVADLEASKVFYETLGFEVTGGSAEENWLILKNGETTIGLFESMFEGNMLTFNPGLTARMERIESFTDVRELASRLESDGIKLSDRSIEGGSGPGWVALSDPDGNKVLIDQFF